MFRKAKFVIFLTAIPLTAVTSQTLQYVGLGHEAIGSIAADQSTTTTVYAASVWHLDSTRMTPGGVFKTTNRGATWDTLLRGFAVVDLKINPANPKTVYAALGLGGIKKSTDGGTAWLKADSGITIGGTGGAWPRVLSIDPLHPDTLYAGIGGNLLGQIYRSTNGGNFWQSIGDSSVLRYGVSRILVNLKNTREIYASSSYGSGVIRSTDGGFNWVSRGLSGLFISSLEWGSDHSTLYAGLTWQDGGLVVSRDSGITWKGLNAGLPDSGTIGCIRTFPTSVGDWVVVVDVTRLGGEVYYGTNGQWVLNGIVQDPSEMSATLELLSNDLYVGGYGVYRATIVTSADMETPWAATEFSLCQNYPNPFNPTTTIRYAIPQRTHVTLTVFNTLGQQVAALVNESEDEGYHEVKFDGSDLASGVYFYRLQAGEYVATKRLLLLK